MNWLGWAICVLGIWILLTGILGPALNWIGIICGIVIAVLAAIGAVTGKSQPDDNTEQQKIQRMVLRI